MGKKVLKLFLETMLRALVIILGIGIIIMGALLIKTLVNNNELKESKETENGSEIVTEADDANDLTFTSDSTSDDGSSDAETTTVSSTGANILVINATGKSGVAGSWKTTLESLGYTSVEVGNYLAGSLTTTKVCVSGDYDGTDVAANFTSPEMSTIDSLSSSDFDMTIGDYDIVIIVGTTDVQN